MSIPAYDEYTDTGNSFLGDVPVHWRPTKLGFLCRKVGSGMTPKGGSETYVDEGVLFIRSQNVYDEGLRLDDVVYISEEVDQEMAISRVECGDVLLNITGASLGRTCLVPDDIAANVNQHVCIIRLKDASQRQFVAMAMKAFLIKSQIDACQNGAAREGLNFEQIGQLHLAIPPLDEQQAISSFLDVETSKIDGLMSEQRRLIELLKEKRRAVISHAVTQGLKPGAPMKPSGIEWLGDVPEHWDLYRMGVLYSDTAERGNNDLPVLQVSIHHGVSDRELSEVESDRKITRIEDKSKYKRVLPNDLVYNMMRAWQGGFGAVKVEGMVSPAYVVARPKRDFHSQYIEHLFRTPQAIEQMRRYSHGVTDFRLRLYWDNFKNVRVAVPPKSEQREICDHIEEVTTRFDNLSAEAERAIRLLQERRTALISAAVTGKIDVREFTVAGADT